MGAAKIGIGLGVVSILARWVTGNTIFGSPEALVKYGIFGGIGFALMGAFALSAFGFLGLQTMGAPEDHWHPFAQFRLRASR